MRRINEATYNATVERESGPTYLFEDVEEFDTIRDADGVVTNGRLIGSLMGYGIIAAFGYYFMSVI